MSLNLFSTNHILKFYSQLITY